MAVVRLALKKVEGCWKIEKEGQIFAWAGNGIFCYPAQVELLFAKKALVWPVRKNLQIPKSFFAFVLNVRDLAKCCCWPETWVGLVVVSTQARPQLQARARERVRVLHHQ